MVSLKVLINFLFLFLSLLYETRAQNALFQNYFHKRPNFGVIDEPNSPYSENQSGHSYQPNHMRPPLYSGLNHNFNGGHGNGGPNRGIPIGGYAPPHHMPYGQNGFGFGGMVNNPYQQFPNAYSPYQMSSQLMPHTTNFLNSLRAGLMGGIPAYGFGYGVLGAPNNGFAMNGPYRTTSTNSANPNTNNNNNENLSSAASYLSQKN